MTRATSTPVPSRRDRRHRFAVAGVPDAGGLVGAAGEDLLTVARDGNRQGRAPGAGREDEAGYALPDEFLDQQLKPQLLLEACRAAGVPLTLRYQAGYDHSYYTMASFMGDHLAHHARLLNARA